MAGSPGRANQVPGVEEVVLVVGGVDEELGGSPPPVGNDVVDGGGVLGTLVSEVEGFRLGEEEVVCVDEAVVCR